MTVLRSLRAREGEGQSWWAGPQSHSTLSLPIKPASGTKGQKRLQLLTLHNAGCGLVNAIGTRPLKFAAEKATPVRRRCDAVVASRNIRLSGSNHETRGIGGTASRPWGICDGRKPSSGSNGLSNTPASPCLPRRPAPPAGFRWRTPESRSARTPPKAPVQSMLLLISALKSFSFVLPRYSQNECLLMKEPWQS